jgi:hypothetical protein
MLTCTNGDNEQKLKTFVDKTSKKRPKLFYFSQQVFLSWRAMKKYSLWFLNQKIPRISNWNWYMGILLFGHPWTIPKTIFKITTSFSSLIISFLSQ